MSDSHSIENDFLNNITEIIEENISNEQFGVSELARETGMSRSNLLRKIKKLTELSVSQFIRQVRLQHSMEMLRQSSFTVSEVSYKVGFSSTSYFIKCFREYYGYPPGEVGKKDLNKIVSISTGQLKKKRGIVILGVSLSIVLLAAVIFIIIKPIAPKQTDIEKSIAVLPFINDSNDSTNVHIINGLMESILTNLQKIEDLKVISRTSVEKYRNNPKTIPEIARELNVSYFVEGSGQKIGDQILLNIQLIEASSDKHLWAEQYNRESKDIFNLQKEVAINIAGKIEAIITPEEEKQINKIPTENLVAYDYFLKGLDLLYRVHPENLKDAITYFEKAIEQDNKFARAYAAIAIAYYYLDEGQAEKKYSEQINHYADQALLYDAQLPQSLIAKALFYMYNKEYELAVSYLEKALEYNPNYDLVFVFLIDLYVNHIPNREKYLEYALRGLKIDISAYDSTINSLNYLHISNAFLQSGFINEAEKYIKKSLEYDPENLYSERVRAYIHFARTGDLKRTNEILIDAFKKDTTRLNIVKEIGIIYYFMRDYKNSYTYFKAVNEAREAYNLDIYKGENGKIAVVLSKMGLAEEAEKYFKEYKDYTENDQSLYKHLSLAAYYSYNGDTEKAIDQMELFSIQTNYQYLFIPFLKIDPLMDNIKDLPEFKRIIKEMETKFWRNHEQIKASLLEKELI